MWIWIKIKETANKTLFHFTLLLELNATTNVKISRTGTLLFSNKKKGINFHFGPYRVIQRPNLSPQHKAEGVDTAQGHRFYWPPRHSVGLSSIPLCSSPFYHFNFLSFGYQRGILVFVWIEFSFVSNWECTDIYVTFEDTQIGRSYEDFGHVK